MIGRLVAFKNQFSPFVPWNWLVLEACNLRRSDIPVTVGPWVTNKAQCGGSGTHDSKHHRRLVISIQMVLMETP